MRKAKVNINHEKLELSSEILRAIAHPLRLKILEFIDQNDLINVNKIYNTLKLEQSITSQHLRILRNAGLLLPVAGALLARRRATVAQCRAVPARRRAVSAQLRALRAQRRTPLAHHQFASGRRRAAPGRRLPLTAWR